MKRLAPLLLSASLLALSTVMPGARATAEDAPPAKSKLISRPAATPATPTDPHKLTPANFRSPKLRGWINDVPDTGQFLADSVWLMRVGPRVTTVGGYVGEWFSSYPEYRPGTDSTGRMTFLNSLMHRDLLGMTALALNRPPGFEDRLALRDTRQRSLAAAVFRRFVADSVTVTDADIRKLWDSYNYQQRLRHILLEDRNAAERVRRELISGRITFAAAVKKYSVAKGALGADGELGWVTPEKLDPNVVYRVYGLKPGEISTPVQDHDGWHIVQSMERKKVQATPYEAVRSPIRDLIRSVLQQERGEKLMALLRLQNGVEYDTSNATFASSKFKETMVVQQNGMSATLNIDGSAPEFANEDTSRIIARWKNGGRFSVGDLIHAFTDIPPVMRPSLQRMETVIGFTESMILEPSIAEYGANQGLEKDPLVAGPMRRKLEELMVEHMYQDSIGTRIWVSKDERKAYYAKNLPQYFTYPSVDFAAILRTSKAGADSVERMLKSGIKATQVLRADSLGGFMSGTIQHRQQNEQGAYQKALFEEMRPGDVQVRGPDKAGEFAVLQVLNYDGGRQLKYEECEQMIDESLQNQKSEAALQAMIGRLKQRYAVAMRPELLMLVKLVDPTID